MKNIIKHYINGDDFIDSQNLCDVYNPALGKVIKHVTLGSVDTLQVAIAAAKSAFTNWANASSLKRSRVLLAFKILLDKNKDELAKLISEEHGKVYQDALGEVQRGIEVVEYASYAPELLKGQFSHNLASGIDCYSFRQPLGICAGITPFNFPAMVPMWMFPISIVCGNTFILKPSEKDPSAAVFIAKLFKEAGLPDGVFNVVHGDKTIVDAILDHSDISAVSFVGSTPIAKYVYERASRSGKRVQALGGANNHCIVMPDADMDLAIQGIMAGAFGSAGERCMALPIVVVVGKETANIVVAKLSIEIDKLHINGGLIEGAHMGPVISKQHQLGIIDYINSGVKQGAKLIRDGRHIKVDGFEAGFFVGPTLFDGVKPGMKIYDEEIFGPVLCIVHVDSLTEAIQLTNHSPYGNGVAIFTKDGTNARMFTNQIHAGMVGVNIPIPVPMAFHSFGGWKASLFGDTHIYGPEGFHFYTRLKTVTTRFCNSSNKIESKFAMPTLE